MTELYIVTMYRYGDRSDHSYVLGAYLTYLVARSAAEREIEYRAGKYTPEILAMHADQTEEHRVVLPLPDQTPHIQRWLADRAMKRRLNARPTYAR